MREQAPQDNGTADISVVHAVHVRQLGEIKMESSFDEHLWLTPHQILAGEFHAALKQAVTDYLKLTRLKELETLVVSGGTSEQIGTLCRKMFPFAPAVSSFVPD